ncbi:MAG: UMP kinase [Candidatus Sedimenticola sp. (ex Thyasira tokunagai)]
MSAVAYQRILLKLSGEALMGGGSFGIDPDVISRVAQEIKELVDAGVQIGLVIGGGNIFRGEGLARSGIDRVSGDHMGMLATVMNSLAMQDALNKKGVPARVLSAIRMDQVCDFYVRREAVRHLENGEVVILSGGSGNPYFTTDSAAGLRAIEINAQVLIKATKVDGIYSADPMKDASAEFYHRLSYDRALSEGLKVMDATAVVLCRDNKMPLRVMNINEPGALMRLMQGEEIGSLVESGGD